MSTPVPRMARLVVSAIVFLFYAIPALAISITFTRLGSCVTPPGCSLTVDDNSTLDAHPGMGIIDFSVPQVGIPTGGVFSAQGRAIENITRDAGGRVVAIQMTLTDTTVMGLTGGVGGPPIIPGSISLVSSEPLRSLNGVFGWASLKGQYENAAGTVGSALLTLQARLGGLLLGNVTGGQATNAPSPVPFSDFDARAWPIPVSNLLFGVFNFGLAPGDSFVLPDSGEAFVTEIPEPATLLLLGLGVTIAAVLGRRRR